MTDGRERRVVVRSAPAKPGGARSVPSPDDLYHRDGYGDALLRSLMKAQLAVTLSVLLPAAVVISLYPLVSATFPAVATLRVGPLPLSALVLGFAIYPPLVALGFWYVRRAQRVEERFVELLKNK